MPAYTLKDIPETLYERIKAGARDNRRSINSELLHRLEISFTSRQMDSAAFLARVRERRESGELPRVRAGSPAWVRGRHGGR